MHYEVRRSWEHREFGHTAHLESNDGMSSCHSDEVLEQGHGNVIFPRLPLRNKEDK